MNKNNTSSQNKEEVIFLWNYVSFVELPKDFQKEMSKNFCAMKYYHQLPPEKKLAVAQKARELNREQMKEYVKYLGNIIT